MIGTLINSTKEKNELPGQILSFNADESFSKQNKTRQWMSHRFCCFMFILVPFGGIFIMSEILKLQSVTEKQRRLLAANLRVSDSVRLGRAWECAFLKFSSDRKAAGPSTL